MKKIALVLAVMMLIAVMPSAMAEEKITLNVWSFTNEFQGMIEKYFAPSHPDIDFTFTLYPTDGGEYTSHVDTLFAADATAEDAPDIFTLEAAFVKKYIFKPCALGENKVGVEVNFNQEFYVPETIESVEDVLAEIRALDRELAEVKL